MQIRVSDPDPILTKKPDPDTALRKKILSKSELSPDPTHQRKKKDPNWILKLFIVFYPDLCVQNRSGSGKKDLGSDRIWNQSFYANILRSCFFLETLNKDKSTKKQRHNKNLLIYYQGLVHKGSL